MKISRFTLLLLLSAALAFAVGMIACGGDGDDDGDNGEACGQAYDQLTSTECTTQALANVNTLKDCVEQSGGTVDDVDACLNTFRGLIPDCVPAVDVLFDGCGACQEACGTNFAGDETVQGCLRDVQETGPSCFNALIACVNNC